MLRNAEVGMENATAPIFGGMVPSPPSGERQRHRRGEAHAIGVRLLRSIQRYGPKGNEG